MSISDSRLKMAGFAGVISLAAFTYLFISSYFQAPAPEARIYLVIAIPVLLLLLVWSFRFIHGRYRWLIIALDLIPLAAIAGLAEPLIRDVKLPASEARLVMRDLRAVSTALDQFKVARGHYPEARTIQELEAQLSPTYLRIVPRHDRWKHALRYEAWKEKPEEEGPQHYSIGSPGADGKFEKEPLRTRVLEAPKDSGADIILTDGRFVSTPEPQADDAPAALAGLADTPAEEADPDLIFAQATALYRNNDYSRAIPLFEKFLALRPDHPLGTARLAASLCQSGRLDDAIPVLQRAINLNPADYQSQANLALAYERLYKPELAIKPAREAAKLQPENSDVLNILGRVLISSGQPAEAIEPLEKATRTNPDNMMAFYNLGVACHRLGKDERAMRVLKVLDLRDRALAQDLRVELSR